MPKHTIWVHGPLDITQCKYVGLSVCLSVWVYVCTLGTPLPGRGAIDPGTAGYNTAMHSEAP